MDFREAIVPRVRSLSGATSGFWLCPEDAFDPQIATLKTRFASFGRNEPDNFRNVSLAARALLQIEVDL